METSPECADFSVPIPHPTLKIALTPMMESDGSLRIRAMNHPSVYMNLASPPFPYTENDWNQLYLRINAETNENLAKLRLIQDSREPLGVPSDWSQGQWLDSTMSFTIRFVDPVEGDSPNGSFLGEIRCARDGFRHILDEGERQRLKSENDKREPGDPNISWEIGCWLAPEHQGRGIMPCALKTLMDEIMVPYLNAHIVTGGYFEHNLASKRLFEKCGFSHITSVPEVFTINPAKIGGVKGRKLGVGLMEWRLTPSN